MQIFKVKIKYKKSYGKKLAWSMPWKVTFDYFLKEKSLKGLFTQSLTYKSDDMIC